MTGAATKIQAFVRARQTYRAWENTTYPYLIRWKQQTAVVADNLVSELLEDEVIPDVLIDIFSHAGDVDDPFAPNPEEDRQVWSLWVEIVNEVVAELGDGICRQVIQSFVNGYLQTRREAEQISPDPVAVVIEDIAGEVADDAAKKIVGECINEMVQSYLRQQTADDFLNTTLQPLIAEVAHLAMDDLEVDNIVADMVEEYILATSQEVASESFLEMKDTIFDERQRRQYSEVAEAAQRIFDNTSLRMLVRTMATNAESILMRDYMNRLASGMLGKLVWFGFSGFFSGLFNLIHFVFGIGPFYVMFSSSVRAYFFFFVFCICSSNHFCKTSTCTKTRQRHASQSSHASFSSRSDLTHRHSSNADDVAGTIDQRRG